MVFLAKIFLMAKLIIVRHGQSQWNLENRFTGWVDVDLTEKGKVEAEKAAEKLKQFKFDAAFSSVLMRANKTLDIILKNLGQSYLPVQKNEALNERHYGDLQGKNKQEMRDEYGDEQVLLWRRSYDVAPPNGESLKDTKNRVIPYYDKTIKPLLDEGKTVIVSAHGNSLRALMMHIEDLTPEEILEREIPTGSPIFYEFDEAMNLIKAEKL